MFPLVLYNGTRPWNTPQAVTELIEPVPGLVTYRPQLRYLLLDQGRLAGSSLLRAAVAELAQSGRKRKHLRTLDAFR